jgi:cystathionine beta-synthase
VRAPVFESVSDAIGGTPLFRLGGLGRGIATPVYAKAEFLSVGGSVKDRAALAMVEAAERDGQLRAGGTIVEATSGNTAIGLAIVGRQRELRPDWSGGLCHRRGQRHRAAARGRVRRGRCRRGLF